MNNKLNLGISIMNDANFVKASYPLFEAGEVDVIEWSFDTILKENMEPEWLESLLYTYSKENKLLGHGVYYSLFDASWSEKQELWLKRLQHEVKKYHFSHITEHFGYMSSDDFHSSVPLPVELNTSTLAIGIDRLKRLQDAVKIPVGIENLAFSFSKQDVEEQAIFIDKMIEEIDGFILLDIHNLYCQSYNFGIPLLDLVKLYNLDKVKEIHLSGGSFIDSIRRDTHDEKIPSEIIESLDTIIRLCPYLEYVIIERLGDTFYSEEDYEDFLNDYKQVKEIVDNHTYRVQTKQNAQAAITSPPLINTKLKDEQVKLARILKEDSPILSDEFSYFHTERWEEKMITTAKKIIEKWSR